MSALRLAPTRREENVHVFILLKFIIRQTIPKTSAQHHRYLDFQTLDIKLVSEQSEIACTLAHSDLIPSYWLKD